MIKHLRERSARDAGVAELADAWDLKSHGSNPVPVRPRSPAPYRGVEQLVARRAHNPEAAGSSPVSATIKPLRLNGFKGFLFVYIWEILEVFSQFSNTPVETNFSDFCKLEKKGIDGSKNPSDFLVHVIADAFNKAGQEDTFFSRTAYENAGVQNILLSEFWKQEVEPRIQVVRDHLKELDSALILQTMVSLAKTLDDAIVQLKHPKEERAETDVIDDLLRDLMRFREKRKGHAGPYVICSP